MTFYSKLLKMAAPCALIASCCDYNPQNIVKHILNVPELPESQSVVESVVAYDWHIDTKYYTADVLLCTTNARTIGDESFAESVQAFVVYFDSQEESSFKKVESWLPYLAHFNPSVQILVCQTSREEDVVGRQTALEWCIKNGFELVELEPDENSENDEEDDFVESTGVKRIIQALQAHTWPNLTLKSRSSVCLPFFRNMMQEEATFQSSAGARNKQDERSDGGCLTTDHSTTSKKAASATASVCKTREAAVENQTDDKDSKERESGKSENESTSNISVASRNAFDELVPDDNELAILAALGNEDPDDESFEQLFSKVKLMKDKALTLPPEERKSYAEQVAVTFWRAIGGDEDEIEGIFDDQTDDPAQT